MTDPFTQIESIADVHRLLACPPPKHPLITLINALDIVVPKAAVGTKAIPNLYMIALKDSSYRVDYGRKPFDFSDGTMVFSAPGQAYTFTQEVDKGQHEGWLLYFHPEMIRPSHLGDTIDKYSFFEYDVREGLHTSEEETQILNQCLLNIKREYEQAIDHHSKDLIASNLEVLLNYCLRFYDRQFHTRSSESKDVVAQFEKELKSFYQQGKGQELGVPTIKRFAESAHLSQHYFSDLIKKETGRAPKDHINDHIIDQAKRMLLATQQPVGEIAYTLGFSYPQYFNRLFKSKTGITPTAYRNPT
ncbi:MAG: helix-turn-helix transcriptional regulator [Bacteroidota bacterium]